VFKLLRYLKAMQMMIHTKFCEDMSNILKDMANYDKIQNGGHVVHPILAKWISTEST
jgi:hypothetical protein